MPGEEARYSVLASHIQPSRSEKVMNIAIEYFVSHKYGPYQITTAEDKRATNVYMVVYMKFLLFYFI